MQGRSSEKTWLVSILRNKIIDYYRKNLVKGDDQSGKKETPISHFNDDGSWQPEATATNWNALATAQIESKEFFEAFNKCIDGLKGNSHAAFVMKYLDEEESEDAVEQDGEAPVPRRTAAAHVAVRAQG